MDLVELRRQRGTIRTRLTLFKKYLIPLLEQKKPAQVTVNECALRLTKIQESYNVFEEIQSNIELQDSSLEEQNQREDTENAFFSLMAQAQDFIATFKEENHQGDEFYSQSSRQRAGLKNVKLPQLRLLPFDGKADKWLEFRDLYLSLIHNNEDVDDICKFHYLKSYLEGDASLVIKSVSVSAESYSIAWSLLCERYDNKRLLINQHLKSLFGIEPLSRESDKGIRQLIDNLSKNLQALNSLGEPTDKWDTLIIYMASSKLDSTTARRWEEFRSDITSPSLQDFYKFLRNRADVLETVFGMRNDKRQTEVDTQNNRQNVSKTKAFFASDPPSSSSANVASYPCVSCKQNHRLIECPKFNSLSVDERYLKISQWKLCKNCLRPGHITYQCRASGCRTCGKRHSTLLHKEMPDQQQNEEEAAAFQSNNQRPQTSAAPSSSNAAIEPESAILSNTSVTMIAADCQQVLLSTALVEVATNGNRFILRALLDSGSQSSFLTEKARQKIGCNTTKVNRSVSGINNASLKINAYCDLELSSLHTPFNGSVRCYIVPTITDTLPSLKVQAQFNIPDNISLADPKFYSPADVDLLLGADIFWDLVGSNQVRLGKDKPVLTETQLGWIVAGPTGERPRDVIKSHHIHCNVSQDVRKQMSKFRPFNNMKGSVRSKVYYNTTLFNRDSNVTRTSFQQLPDAPHKMSKYYGYRHLTEVPKQLKGEKFLSNS